MKLWIRILFSVLCAVLILSMPILLTTPQKITANKDGERKQEEIENAVTEDEDSEVIDFSDLSSLFISSAFAEDDETIVQAMEDDMLYIDPEWKLPLDFSAAPKPNPACFTEDGYVDQSIQVCVETKVIDGITVNVAFVRIADASQLRTAVAGTAQNSRVDKIHSIAGDMNPVIAMNGDHYTELPDKKTFEVRMTETIRAKTNNMKDILIIDDLGNFHLFIRSNGLHKNDKPYYISQIKEEGRKVINAMTFGPALVMDGEIVDQTQNEKDYSYNPNRKEPRAAIGQTGDLSYVMVIVEGRGVSPGATFRELARIMYDLGCTQAYNLDGGNTAEMIMFGPEGKSGDLKFHLEGQKSGGERSIKDIIYFATAVPESEW